MEQLVNEASDELATRLSLQNVTLSTVIINHVFTREVKIDFRLLAF